MISPRLARLRKAAFVASPLCLPVAATAPKPETLIFYSLRGKLCAAPGTEKFFLLFLSWKSLRRVGDSSSSSSSQGGTALGGTVAVVSPALSRPSPPANESSSAGRGGWSPGERTSAAPPPPTLLSLSGQNGKLLPATPPTTSKSTQKTTPDHNFATTLAIITVLLAIMTATVEKVS